MSFHSFGTYLCSGQVDRKRADTLGMIAAIQISLTAGLSPLQVSYRFHDTGYHKAASRSFNEETNRLPLASWE